jgi:cyclase
MTLRLNGEEVRITKLPVGKTDGDALIYFKNAKVAVTGDAFITSTLPATSKYAGGNMLGIAEELRRIVALVPADTKVVPGHGPLASIDDVRKASEALDGIRDAVAAQMAKGKTRDQILEMNLLEPWKDLVAPPGQGPPYVRFFYDHLERFPEMGPKQP